MSNYDDTEEELLDEVKYDDDEEVKAALEAAEKMYPTKDIYVAAFLLARGFKLASVQRKRVTTVHGGKRMPRKQTSWFFVFVDYQRARRDVIEYSNRREIGAFNINAGAFASHLQNLKSLITNL